MGSHWEGCLSLRLVLRSHWKRLSEGSEGSFDDAGDVVGAAEGIIMDARDT